MDKLMKKVTSKIRTAEGMLKDAETRNVKLTAKDKKRDAFIKKAKSKGCK